jgi:hypothetical protein
VATANRMTSDKSLRRAVACGNAAGGHSVTARMISSAWRFKRQAN